MSLGFVDYSDPVEVAYWANAWAESEGRTMFVTRSQDGRSYHICTRKAEAEYHAETGRPIVWSTTMQN